MGTRRVTRPTGTPLAAPVTLLVLAWASTFAAIKVGLDHCPPLLFAGLRAKMGGLLLGFAGVVTVSASSLRADVPLQGVVLALLSALAWALGTIYLKPRENTVTYPWAVTGQFLVGGILLTGLGLVAEDPAAISWQPMFWGALLYAGLVGSALAWALWFWLVRAGEASRAAAYIFFVPLTAIAIGAVLLDEPVTPLTALGAVLVVLGIYLTNRCRRAAGG